MFPYMHASSHRAASYKATMLYLVVVHLYVFYSLNSVNIQNYENFTWGNKCLVEKDALFLPLLCGDWSQASSSVSL